jgi:hydrogenase nickel incorporation protein HypA/HybF
VHELSIAEAILDRIAAEAERHPGGRFTKVGVRIGELSGVDPEALSFGFEVLVKDTRWDPLALDIQFCPRMQYCRGCDYKFRATDSETACPQCGSPATECVGGDELDVVFMELEEA